MNIDLTPIIQAIIALMAAVITYKLIPWIKAKTTNEQQAMLSVAVKTFVFAAEQLYGEGQGVEKFAYVVKRLEEKGYTVDPAQIEAVIKENLAALHAKKTDAEGQ